jgi:hypothetical protein
LVPCCVCCENENDDTFGYDDMMVALGSLYNVKKLPKQRHPCSDSLIQFYVLTPACLTNLLYHYFYHSLLFFRTFCFQSTSKGTKL